MRAETRSGRWDPAGKRCPAAPLQQPPVVRPAARCARLPPLSRHVAATQPTALTLGSKSSQLGMACTPSNPPITYSVSPAADTACPPRCDTMLQGSTSHLALVAVGGGAVG